MGKEAGKGLYAHNFEHWLAISVCFLYHYNLSEAML